MEATTMADARFAKPVNFTAGLNADWKVGDPHDNPIVLNLPHRDEDGIEVGARQSLSLSTAKALHASLGDAIHLAELKIALQAIKMKPVGFGRLRCDTPACGYNEALDRPIEESMIGCACPRCGAVMLTAQDFAAANAAMQRLAAFAPSAEQEASMVTVGQGHFAARDGAVTLDVKPSDRG